MLGFRRVSRFWGLGGFRVGVNGLGVWGSGFRVPLASFRA